MDHPRGHRLALVIILFLLFGLGGLIWWQANQALQSLDFVKTSTVTSRLTPDNGVDPVIVAAGDIACAPGNKLSVSTCQQVATAQLVEKINPSLVLTLGDNQYPSGELNNFNSPSGYAGSWGKFKAKTKPSPGNHEYQTADAAGYFSYFGTTAGPAGQGYYSFDAGSWHLISLNSEIEVGSSSPQRQWLKADLAKHKSYCTLAYWHKPRFSSGFHPSDSKFEGLWQDLYKAGADVVLNGHSHSYERFEPQDPKGNLDGVKGVTEFVSGMGGVSTQPLTATQPHSVIRQNTVFGVLKMTLHDRSYSFSFEGISGSPVFSDNGQLPCHS